MFDPVTEFDEDNSEATKSTLNYMCRRKFTKNKNLER